MQTKHAQLELLSVSDACARLGVSPTTLKRWEKAGRISALRTPTGHRRYHRIDVDALLRHREVSA